MTELQAHIEDLVKSIRIVTVTTRPRRPQPYDAFGRLEVGASVPMASPVAGRVSQDERGRIASIILHDIYGPVADAIEEGLRTDDLEKMRTEMLSVASKLRVVPLGVVQ